MHHFEYRQDELYCEEVPVRLIADSVGTPFYLYSHATLSRHFQVFDQALAQIPHLVCYAVKACSNIAILRLFASLGSGADIVSGGELFRALQAGIPPERIVYSGVGKTDAELRYALRSGIRLFNVESLQELDRLEAVAASLDKMAPVAFRINPDIDPRTHPYISTGLAKNKFGIPVGDAPAAYRHAASLPHLRVRGISCHIGSQLTEVAPFVAALERVKALARELKADGIPLDTIDLGGGLGITYDLEQPPLPADYAAALAREWRDLDCTLLVEPGRVIVGNAAILVSRVLYTKQTALKSFVVVDAGMNDLARPSLYNAFHAVQPVVRQPRGEQVADLVGPICETGDFLARDRVMPAFAAGDLVAVMSAGAYGFSMASNYNSRPRPPEVLVRGEEIFVIRRRETYASLIAGEAIPAFLEGPAC
ncbi:MAG: diaminopimelate decarboxylase [Thermodesulfobacteriota bacterium]